jgi:AraC-like DNA-binding protein
LEQLSAERSVPVRAKAGRGFRGRLAFQDLGGEVSLSLTEFGPSEISHPERKSAVDVVFFRTHLDGHGRVRQHGREATLAAGAGTLYESRSGWDLLFSADVKSVNLQLPRGLLPFRSAEIADLCARPMPPGSASMRLFTGYLDQLRELAVGLSPQQRSDAGQAAVELLVMTLREEGPAAATGDGPDIVLLQVMREYVRRHAGDPGLTVAALARRHHLSVRHLYALFARIDVTPAAFIREQRLLKARSLLLDRRYDSRPMTGIAAAVGFAEPRTFERAFRREFGTTPVKWRRDHRTGA